MILIVWYSEEGKTIETVKGSVVSRGYLSWRMTKRSKEKFFREMKLPSLYDTTVLGSCHYMFAQTNRFYSTKSES